MELDNPNILFFNNQSQLSLKILDIIGQWKAQIHSVSSAEELKEAFEGVSYDLFICLPGTSFSNIEQILQSNSNNITAMITCLIMPTSNSSTLDCDFFISEEELSNPEIIVHYLSDIFKIAKTQKNQIELSSMLLHDLRSPMQSILGYLELLEKEIFGEINEGQHQILSNAFSIGDTIIDLIDELSQIYQFEKKQFELIKTQIQLKELLDEALRTLWVQADKKNIKFIPQITSNLPDISADAKAIQRVLINLLTNAIKYSPEKGTVRIVVQPVQTSAHIPMVQFRIVDSGPGIPSEQINNIFDKYFRIKGNKRSPKGYGLGLYISKLIVEAHNGQIGAYNNREGGSTLYFTLPINNENDIEID